MKSGGTDETGTGRDGKLYAAYFLYLFPIAGFFFLDWVEWCFAIAPAHWVAKAVQHSLLQPAIDAGLTAMNLNFYQYLGLGYVYNLLLVAAAYSLFKRNNQL